MVLFDSNKRAKNGRGGAGRRDSEEVAPRYPVMPIADRFGGGFVRIDGGQLRKRDGHFPSLPPDLHEHIARAGTLRREAADFDSLSFPEWRGHFHGNAFCREGEADFI